MSRHANYASTQGLCWRACAQERHEVVITWHSKPAAMMVGVPDDDLEDTVKALRRARAHVAVARLHVHSLRAGLGKMAPEEIEAEIQAARAARR